MWVTDIDSYGDTLCKIVGISVIDLMFLFFCKCYETSWEMLFSTIKYIHVNTGMHTDSKQVWLVKILSSNVCDLAWIVDVT